MGIASIMAQRAYNPPVRSEFWCNHCDANIVDSARKESGQFYVTFGHSFRAAASRGEGPGHGHYDGIYTGVMFALCNHCLDASDEKPAAHDRDLAHEADMRALRKAQLRADIDDDELLGDPDEYGEVPCSSS